MKIEPVTGWSLGISGKSLLNTGAANRANACITPPFSPIFMMPSQSDKIPVNPNEISKPVLAEAKEALNLGKNGGIPTNDQFTYGHDESDQEESDPNIV